MEAHYNNIFSWPGIPGGQLFHWILRAALIESIQSDSVNLPRLNFSVPLAIRWQSFYDRRSPIFSYEAHLFSLPHNHNAAKHIRVFAQAQPEFKWPKLVWCVVPFIGSLHIFLDFLWGKKLFLNFVRPLWTFTVGLQTVQSGYESQLMNCELTIVTNFQEVQWKNWIKNRLARDCECKWICKTESELASGSLNELISDPVGDPVGYPVQQPLKSNHSVYHHAAFQMFKRSLDFQWKFFIEFWVLRVIVVENPKPWSILIYEKIFEDQTVEGYRRL